MILTPFLDSLNLTTFALRSSQGRRFGLHLGQILAEILIFLTPFGGGGCNLHGGGGGSGDIVRHAHSLILNFYYRLLGQRGTLVLTLRARARTKFE